MQINQNRATISISVNPLELGWQNILLVY